jgi:hypothetical protein
MEEDSAKVKNTVARVMVLRRYAQSFLMGMYFVYTSYYFSFLNLPCSLLHSNSGWLSGLQSDEQCCNSCEEVREAYKKKGWALTNPDLIDQVY